MKQIPLLAERLRLRAEIWLHRYGPWWLVLALALCLLLSAAAFLIPSLSGELAANRATLANLRARLASNEQPEALPESTSERHYLAFRQTLAEESQVLLAIKEVLDSAASHQLSSTRAEYLRGRDLQAQAESMQMTVPVKGHYADVRRWIEEMLAKQAFLAVNELSFKRDEIGLNEIEARVRLTIWHHPARPVERAGEPAAGEVRR